MQESTQQQLGSIFNIFRDMTEDKRPLYEASTPNFLAKCESISLKFLILFLLLIIAFAASSKILAISQENKNTVIWILYAPLAFSWLIYMISALAGLVAIYFRQRKMPGKHSMIMKQIQQDIEEDYDRIIKLKLYPKDLLEYAFMQYKATWSVMNDRTALIVGDLK
ncbi:hypothetical protein, partial [Xanthomonas translucens]